MTGPHNRLTQRLGPRWGLEVGFLLAVAVALGLLEVSWPAIVAAMAIAWLLVATVEIVLSRRSAQAEGPAETPVLPETAPSPDGSPAPLPLQPVAEPEPAAPVAEPEPTPPEPEPEPEHEPEPPAPVAERPPAVPVVEAPREWNLWELERIAREHAGADPARDEERTYLLLSLRDFARPDGDLPLEFDPLVRDAFGDLLHTAA